VYTFPLGKEECFKQRWEANLISCVPCLWIWGNSVFLQRTLAPYWFKAGQNSSYHYDNILSCYVLNGFSRKDWIWSQFFFWSNLIRCILIYWYVMHIYYACVLVCRRCILKLQLHCNTHCNTMQRTTAHGNTLQHTATHCNTLQHTATNYNTLQRNTTHWNTLDPHTGNTMRTHCNTTMHTALQHTATHFSALQHTA